MAHIIETIAFDRRLSLGHEAYIRRMTFGAQWSLLRIGIRWSVNGRSDIESPFPFLGVCADTSSVFQGDRPTGFIGVSYRSASYGMTFNARQYENSYYTTPASPFSTWNQFGMTPSDTALNWGGGVAFGIQATPATPHYWYVTLYKTGPRYELRDIAGPTISQIPSGGKSEHQFFMDMDNELGVNLTNSTRSAYTTFMASSHIPMPYVCVGWKKSTPSIEITHLSVVKFA